MIELASVIRDLREELDRAVSAAEGEALRFELGPIELELSVALERNAQAQAKVRFLVVDSGADARLGKTSTQRISLTLKPTLAGSHRPVAVSGNAEPNER
ncbi:trypco2 family protein [Streptomyces sp. NPDC005794]|uniref:trypco2 family protein n=1 Tax=Streptomyces sp. NPDC005794 TaxID=3364733 RepID=UPI00368A9194